MRVKKIASLFSLAVTVQQCVQTCRQKQRTKRATSERKEDISFDF
jgi:hypothetical protein